MQVEMNAISYPFSYATNPHAGELEKKNKWVD
jgi:hypothetical protein